MSQHAHVKAFRYINTNISCFPLKFSSIYPNTLSPLLFYFYFVSISYMILKYQNGYTLAQRKKYNEEKGHKTLSLFNEIFHIQCYWYQDHSEPIFIINNYPTNLSSKNTDAIFQIPMTISQTSIFYKHQ